VNFLIAGGALFFSLLLAPALVHAQTVSGESFEAQVTQIVAEKTVVFPGSEEPILEQTLELLALTGTRSGQLFTLTNGGVPVANLRTYQPGQRLVIYHENFSNRDTIADVVRRPTLLLLVILFVLAAVIIGRTRGVMALVGLIFSFVIIFTFILPQIAAGANPITIVVLSALMIIPVIFLLAHGWHKKTFIAMVGTFLALIMTGLVTVFFVQLAHLTGLASEEAGFLLALNPELINLKNLLIAGMLIATIGVLDDITLAQAGVVEALNKANPDLTSGQLYRQAMVIGRDHIASMINTLILVYAGASFPLLLLFQHSGQSLALTLNFEVIAEEIIRTLTGSLGLILAVPLTTMLAVFFTGGAPAQK
jgi:uncharacterized membrane protein